jgi:hypothetical protein
LSQYAERLTRPTMTSFCAAVCETTEAAFALSLPRFPPSDEAHNARKLRSCTPHRGCTKPAARQYLSIRTMIFSAAVGRLQMFATINITRTEPLPWSELFAARGRALAHAQGTNALTLSDESSNGFEPGCSQPSSKRSLRPLKKRWALKRLHACRALQSRTAS